MFSFVQGGFAQTCIEPSRFCEAAWADWFIHLCLEYIFTAKAHPHYPACSWCCIRRKASWNRWVFNLEIKPVQLHWEPLPVEGEKNSRFKKAESASALPFCRSTTGNLRDSASPFHPCTYHVSSTSLLLPLLPHLFIHPQVCGFGTTQTNVFPSHSDLHRLISVLIK